MRVAASPSFDLLDTPLRDQQVIALNKALTDEVQRHAETRQALRDALTFCWLIKERVEPVEVVCEVPLKLTRHVPWTPGAARPSSRFPLALADRIGVAALLRRRLQLRSGAVLDPVNVAVCRGNRSAVFPDSSWLVLSMLAQRPGEFVPGAELGTEIFGSPAGNTVRSAVHRARMTLAVVHAQDDIETTRINRAGYWRLLLAEER